MTPSLSLARFVDQTLFSFDSFQHRVQFCHARQYDEQKAVILV